MTRWWRAYDEALHDPKLLALSDKQFRAWFNLLCIASKNGGELPPITTVALELRMSMARAAEYISALVTMGLMDEIEPGRLTPHNWNGRQYKSDVSTPRVKRFRERPRNVSVTPPETETETETEEGTADAVTPSKVPYAFESGVIRINQKDFDSWKRAFSHLDLAAELVGLSPWAEEQGSRWFHALSGALTKKNRELGLRLEQSKQPQAFKWRSGIEGVT